MSENKRISTGLLFGSFNPIHVGHMIIANHLVEHTSLKEIWFVVSPQNPFKEKQSLLAAHHRLAMVRIAIENDHRFKASDIEFNLEQPSYTIHTLMHLKEKYPQRDFALIMGGDNIGTFHKWKNHEEIIANHKIYVYDRPDSETDFPYKNHANIEYADAPMMDISSSYIRNCIQEKKDVKYLLTESVYKYLMEMHFYE